MTAPITLTLVRHGESESNAAKHSATQGKAVPREAELMGVHTSERRLTLRGVEQAQQTGRWLREHWLSLLEEKRGYVSPYVRASETAGYHALGLEWRMDSRLCERNWGELDQMTHEQRLARFEKTLVFRKEHALFWTPSGGESLMGVFLRLRDITATLHRECSQMLVLVVSHGETMYAWRYLNEYWIPQDLRESMSSTDKRFDIFNCRIIQYSRLDQDDTLQKKFVKVRFVNPMKPDDPATNHDWMPVKRKLWSDTDLLGYTTSHKRFLEAS